jgi:NADH-quinone oxidoreductase subunit K
MIIPIGHILIFTLMLFAIGMIGILTRRNAIGILIAIELLLNAVNVNLVCFSRVSENPMAGQMFAFFVIALAAAAAAVGLAIVVAIYRTRNTVQTDEIQLLKW